MSVIDGVYLADKLDNNMECNNTIFNLHFFVLDDA